MFIAILTYKKPLSEVDNYLSAHREYLAKHYAIRRFITSGPQIPRIGGVIMIKANNREAVDAIISEDPFHINDIANYQIVEFTPTMFCNEELKTILIMMRLSLRPYQPTDANVITTWLKNEYLMRQWCADRYECYPVTPEDMNIYHERYIDGQSQRALTMLNGNNIVGYITLRTPADDSSEQRLGFVIVDDSKTWSRFW